MRLSHSFALILHSYRDGVVPLARRGYCYHRFMLGSRRSFLLTGLGARLLAQATRGTAFAGGVRRYPDPLTEFDVYLLTDPTHTSLLPAYYNRAITKNSATLLFTSDRGGSPQAYRMDLKNAQTRLLTDA